MIKQILLAMTGWCDSGLNEYVEFVIGVATSVVLGVGGIWILHNLAHWM